ncbi:MAG: N-acetylneuraminate synthase family protein, partial [Desulfohalobiaceae bacterium]|nr:N-acetylneuraminate synthase family protein [Desulfohalobiaceae bacterium]
MIIDKDIKKYIVFSEDSLLHALEKISNNKMRIVFAVNEVGLLEGIMTDGDFRRWLTKQQDFNLNRPVIEVANRDFLSFPEQTPLTTIEPNFSEKIEHIPLVDDYFRLVGVATRRTPEISIQGRIIDQESPCFIIAEIGNNHNGDAGLAGRLVEAAVDAGADCAKFQLRDLNSLYRTSGAKNRSEDLGTEYTLDLLDKFQLPEKELFTLFDYCHELQIIPMCTPYDLFSLERLENYGLPAYKVASADLTNDHLLQALAATGKPLICSTGMSREREIVHAVDLLHSYGAKYVLLHCNATYPAPFKDVQLGYLSHLREIGRSLVGYSGHERGISVPISAVALGAKVVEKHLTLDKTMEGRDHQASLLPEEFRYMVQGIREVELSLGGPEDGRIISQGELINRESLAKSLVAGRKVPKGTIIGSEVIEVKSPGMGLPPYRRKELIGKKAKRDIPCGDFFYPSDVEDETAIPRNYDFPRSWGIPVRFHDLGRMAGLSNMDFVEFHLSYKDLEVDLKDIFEGRLDLGFTVHSPELFAGDHILDLCSLDPSYWEQSLQEMQRVIDLGKRLQDYLPGTTRPLIITNVGGFSLHAHLPAHKRGPLYERLEEALDQLNTDGVEIIPQTMPPFPWHFGGQRYHNLFVDPNEIASFCEKNQMRICLDVSHSKLACNHFKISFTEFIRLVGPYTAHLHLADASGVDGEGLQINQGEIDFK